MRSAAGDLARISLGPSVSFILSHVDPPSSQPRVSLPPGKAHTHSGRETASPRPARRSACNPARPPFGDKRMLPLLPGSPSRALGSRMFLSTLSGLSRQESSSLYCICSCYFSTRSFSLVFQIYSNSSLPHTHPCLYLILMTCIFLQLPFCKKPLGGRVYPSSPSVSPSSSLLLPTRRHLPLTPS